MEFEEQKEVVNPQNGEKIVIKKKKFWLEWRFWVWSFIALMLFFVSLSSLVTACAAINAGVGSDQNTSQVSRERKAAYYREECVSDYGTAVGYVYNYVCDLKTGETYPNFWYLDNKDVAGCSTGLRANTALEEQYIDVYRDGVYYDTSYLPSVGYLYIPFTDGHYYWLFSNERGLPPAWDGYYEAGAPYRSRISYMYNYSSYNLHVSSNAVQNNSVDLYAGNPFASGIYPESMFHTYSGTVFYVRLLVSDQVLKDHLFLDVYCDGAFYKRVPVMWNRDASWNTSYQFELPAPSHYYWIFNADLYSVGYSAGYDAGASQVRGFDSVGTNAMYAFQDDLTGLSNNSYPMFDFVDAERNPRSVWLSPYTGTSLDRAKFVVRNGFSSNGSVLATIGECYLDSSSNVFSASGTYTDYSSPNCVIRNVYNDSLSRGIFRLVASDVSPYATGYAKGYDDGESVGYAIGKVDGANSVQPEALTNTLVAVFQQPFNQIYRFFNFNVLGLNILGLVCGLLSVFIVIKVIKKVI